MKKHLISILLPWAWIGLLALFSGCTATYYTPNTHNLALLSEEKEFQASGSFGNQGHTREFSLQAAFSPVKNLGLQVNASNFNAFDNIDPTGSSLSYGLSGKIFGGAAGYYRNLGSGFLVDVYGGYDLFRGDTRHIERGRVDFQFHRIYVRPALGYKNDIIDIALSLRASNLNYQAVQYERDPDPNAIFDDNYIGNGQNHVITEPALTLRLGYRYIKFQGQFGFAYNLSNLDLEYSPVFFSVGMCINFRTSFEGEALPPFMR